MATISDLLAGIDRQAFEKAAMRASRAEYIGPNVALCRIYGDLLIYVDPTDLAVAPHLITRGYWESWVSVAMLRRLQWGMTAVDVGANFGYYTLLMARSVGPTGSVLAFEPNPMIAALLRKSISICGFESIVRTDERAAYSTTGQVKKFLVTGSYLGSGTIVDNDATLTSFDVNTVALDEVLPSKVDFIKIDAEGAEPAIWQGLRKTVLQNRMIQIFMEFDPRRTGFDSIFLTDIRAGGFSIAVISPDGSTIPASIDSLLKLTDLAMLHLSR